MVEERSFKFEHADSLQDLIRFVCAGLAGIRIGRTDVGVFDDSHVLENVLAHRVGVRVEGAVVQDRHEHAVVEGARLVPAFLPDEIVQPDLVFGDEGGAAGNHPVRPHLVGK